MKRFGKLPSGARLQKIKASPNFRDGQFQNIHHTPNLTEGATYTKIMKAFLFGRPERSIPKSAIPSVHTDLLTLDPAENILVWFGHSSYFMQLDGKRFLIDPVLSGTASPFSFTTKAFAGTDRYTVEDIPGIDWLFLSHDHYDHLDYQTIIQLKSRIDKVACGLGIGEHLEYWGYSPDRIHELDWHEMIQLAPGFDAHAVPARHFSGRWLKRNRALWLSFVLKTPHFRIFIGGDSGYDIHFAEIGKTFGEFDLAILENGQYDKHWKYIHLMPDEILRAAKDLRTKRVLPVHSGKFALGNHEWDEPLELLSRNNEQEKLNVITPMIGEKVDLDNPEQVFSAWWREVQ
jgi:L-ascorbate metabolism protein UlaG (beta-lactamase superfamily)